MSVESGGRADLGLAAPEEEAGRQLETFPPLCRIFGGCR